MSENNDIILEMKNITKDFPSVRALDSVSLTVRAGTVHALMGENGAGKSTLMKCLFGIHRMDGGTILLGGREVSFKNPKEALENGVAMVHQELSQALKRSVMDNLWLGRYPKLLGLFVNERKMYRDTEKVYSELGLSAEPETIMGEMPVAKRQMAEIAKAVSYGARVIVLDEPTSSLSDKEVEQLFKIIENLKKKGCAIIYISHKMEEILKISDVVTVMRDGRHVATKNASELDISTIIKLMVGRALESRFPPKNTVTGETVLSVTDLCTTYTGIKNVSFDLNEGEILGVAGLDGSGRTELLECLFGLAEKKSGSITLKGQRIYNSTPRQAIRNGFALLTEERRNNGIFSILSITDNTVISSIKRYLLGGFYLQNAKMNEVTDSSINSLKIKTASKSTQIRSLSGGNQQKVILGRWLLTSPEILLLDEPTRGIDVGAKYEIYRIIIDLAKNGKSVIVVSSEMPELLGICNRILVMSNGELAGELNADEATQEDIMKLATKNL